MSKRPETVTKQLFDELWGIRLEKIPETSKRKSPDFAVFVGSERIATLEVKGLDDTSLPPVPLAEALSMTVDEFLDSGTRNDNNVARIAKKIHEAVAQFEGIEGPKGLVLYNEEFADHNDLVDALQDGLLYDGERINTLKPAVHAQLVKDRTKIDFYVWIQNEATQTAPLVKKFLWTNEVGERLWEQHFKAREVIGLGTQP